MNLCVDLIHAEIHVCFVNHWLCRVLNDVTVRNESTEAEIGGVDVRTVPETGLVGKHTSLKLNSSATGKQIWWIIRGMRPGKLGGDGFSLKLPQRQRHWRDDSTTPSILILTQLFRRIVII